MTTPEEHLEHRVRRRLTEPLASIDGRTREEILRRVVALAAEEVERERRRAVRLCMHRSDLWENTAAARKPAPREAREEARARHNEARYLADLIEQEQEMFDEADA